MATIILPGMPEGMVLIRFGVAALGEYVLAPYGIGVHLSNGTLTGFIVGPADGYQFLDPDHQSSFCQVERLLERPLLISGTILVRTKLQQDYATQCLERCLIHTEGELFKDMSVVISSVVKL